MSKARGLADLGNVYDDGALSNRNLIINGAMQVAQRGASFTGLTNGSTGYTLDRWRWSEGGSPSFVTDVTQDTSAPDGFASSYKIAVTTAAPSLGANHSLRLMTRLEGQDLQQTAFGTSNAKNLTLSFWVKSNKTGTYIAWVYNGDAARHISKAYTVDAADTWEYKTLTIDGDTISGFTNDNGTSIQLEFVLAAGSDYTSGTLATTWQADNLANRYVGNVNLVDSTSNYWQITGVQLEVGDTATPFEHRSFGDELQRCQRYYQEVDRGSGIIAYASIAYISLPYITTMRAAPSFGTTGPLALNDARTNASQTTAHVVAYNANTSGAFTQMDNFSPSLAVYSAALMRGNTGNFVTLDAEL